MKKNSFLFIILAMSLFVVSCSKKSDNNEEDLNSLPFADENVDAGKTSLSNAGDSLLNNLNALQNSTDLSCLETYSYFAGIVDPFPNFAVFSTMKAAGALSQSAKAYSGVFKSMAISADSITSLQSEFNKYKGTHAWNDAFKRWDWYDKTANQVVILYPSTKTGKTNDVKIVITFSTTSSANSPAETYGYSDLPLSLKAVITKGGAAVGEYGFSVTYNQGLPVSSTTYITVGAYKFVVNPTYSASSASVKYSFLRGNTTLLCYYAAATGSFDVNTLGQAFASDSTVNNFVNGANAYFQVLNIKLAGKVDFKSLYSVQTDLDKLTTISDSAYLSRSAEALNKYAALVLVYADSNKKIAQANAYYDKTSYDVKFKVVFKDGTSQDINTYFGNGFSQLTDETKAIFDALNVL
ncbi:MAG: hypothetical protein Q8928_00360 [Bacteroidota bacterium]|nr:hypothetical protein [Bacteroidota bacterium]